MGLRRTVRTSVERWMPSLALSLRAGRDVYEFHGSHPERAAGGVLLSGAGKAQRDDYEQDFRRSFLEHIGAADIFVDVGANVGLYSVLAARLGAGVVAVEPHPRNLRHLLRNLEANQVSDAVAVFPVALTESPGSLTLYGTHASASIMSDWRADSVAGERVPCHRLDDLLRGSVPPDARLLIKVDVEGAEKFVLRGAPETLARQPAPVWMVEVEVEATDEGDLREVLGFFHRNGYRAVGVEHGDEPDLSIVAPRDLASTNYTFLRG